MHVKLRCNLYCCNEKNIGTFSLIVTVMYTHLHRFDFLIVFRRECFFKNLFQFPNKLYII